MNLSYVLLLAFLVGVIGGLRTMTARKLRSAILD